MNLQKRPIALAAAVLVVAGAIVYLNSLKPAQTPRTSTPRVASPTSGGFTPAVDISTPDAFINAGPFTLQDLIGKKVILVDFWTYSCINCQRTLPYLNAWYDKYKDQGLEIVGVHTPEFEFEKKLDNVQKAVNKFGIKYPVVLDNDFSTWQGYGNQYWPRKYLIDIKGNIVYDHIGEGGYEETEQRIQALLQERTLALGDQVRIASGEVQPSDAMVNMLGTRSPEIYFGAGRNEHFGNGQPYKTGIQTLTLPTGAIKDDTFYLSGSWDMQPEYALNKSTGKLVFRYRAMNVYMVASANRPITLRVLRDGVSLNADLAGADVNDGEVIISDERLYHLISEKEGSEHTLQLEVTGPGLQAFTFTFG